MTCRTVTTAMVQAPVAAARAFVAACPSTEPKAWSPSFLLDAIDGHTPPPRPPVSPP
jgi:hypothetical protein